MTDTRHDQISTLMPDSAEGKRCTSVDFIFGSGPMVTFTGWCCLINGRWVIEIADAGGSWVCTSEPREQPPTAQDVFDHFSERVVDLTAEWRTVRLRVLLDPDLHMPRQITGVGPLERAQLALNSPGL